MNYTQILFSNISEEQSEILVARLSDIGYDGFEEETDTLKACIKSESFDENLLNLVIDINCIKYTKSIIEEENWNAKWEADFEPVIVNNPISSKPFVYIRASFHKPDSSFEYDIEVTPKMSFGTGHHATTYLMVEHMSQLNFKNKTVIDFGTGTGVLAILAEKMGAQSILAIDCDDWSIENAKENITVNACTKINIVKAETIPLANVVDIILANINLNVITANIDAIKASTKVGTIILFSGIMLHNEANIVNVLQQTKINIKAVYKMGDWLALLTEVE